MEGMKTVVEIERGALVTNAANRRLGDGNRHRIRDGS